MIDTIQNPASLLILNSADPKLIDWISEAAPGVRVVSANSAEQIQAICSQHQVDSVLVDLQNFEDYFFTPKVTSSISQLDQTLTEFSRRNLPVIALTSDEYSHQIPERFSHSIHDCLQVSKLTHTSLCTAIRFAQERFQRIQAENQVEAAKSVQPAFASVKSVKTEEFEFAGFNQPVSEVGGDFYEFFQTDSDCYIAVGDVCGHDLGAALLMAELRTWTRAYLKNVDSPADLLTKVNAELHNWPGGRFATSFVAKLNKETNRLTYIGAGHTAFLCRENGVIEELPSTSLPLGIFDSPMINSKEILLFPGDLLIVPTDGFQEVHSPDQICYGLDRMYEAVQTLQLEEETSLESLIRGLCAEVTNHAQGMPQQDDLTIVAYRVQGESQSLESSVTHKIPTPHYSRQHQSVRNNRLVHQD